jgi:glycosyltransferase involved in cell wall biosynthesis
MACGVPVVSTTVGAITEAVEDGVTGRVVAPRDAAALAAGLAQLRDNPALGVRLAAAARARALAAFGLDRMLDRMEAVFRAVVEAH